LLFAVICCSPSPKSNESLGVDRFHLLSWTSIPLQPEQRKLHMDDCLTCANKQ
jgi:hypothetical protein